MTHIEAVVVLTLLLDQDDEAGKMMRFLAQFPDHAELAKEQWRELFGSEWEE